MKQISVRQFAFIIFLVLTASKLFILPALLIRDAGRDAYLSVVLILIIELFVLLLIIFSARITDETLYSLLDKGATKIGGRIIAVLTLPSVIIKILLLLTELKIFFNSVLGQNMAEWLIMISACLLLFYIGTKTLRGIGRLSDILLPIVFIATIILIALAAGGINLSLLKPFAENGITSVFKNALKYPFWFADLGVMVVFIGQINRKKHFVKTSLIFFVLGLVAVLFFSIIVFAAYGDIPHLLSFFNTTDLLMYSPSGYIHGRFDLPVFCLRAFAWFVQLAINFYFLTRLIGYITKSKNRQFDMFISAFSSVAIFIIITTVFANENVLLGFTSGYTGVFAVIANILLPIFVFIVAIITRKKAKENKLNLKLSMSKFYSVKAKKVTNK